MLLEKKRAVEQKEATVAMAAANQNSPMGYMHVKLSIGMPVRT